MHGDPIPSPNNKFEVLPLTVGNVKNMGEQKYYQYLNILLIDKNSLNNFNSEYIDNNSIYGIFIKLMSESIDINLMAMAALSVFTSETFSIHDNNLYIVKSREDGEFKIPFTKDDFLFLRDVVKRQNYMKIEDETSYKNANNKVAELKKKMMEQRKRAIKNNKDKGLTLSEIVSITSSYSQNVTPFNVWDLSIYELYNQFYRLQIWDNFHIMQYLSPHMEKDANKNTKHWTTPVDPNKYKEEN